MDLDESTWKHNIEGIIEKIKKEAKLTILFKKSDGITFESRTPIDGNRENAIAEMEDILTRLGLVPYQIGRHKEVSNSFLVQFPELDVIYSNEEKIKMYKNIFKFLLDNINQNRKEPVSKSFILDFKEVYTKQTIQAFARSNLNRYKVNVDDMLNDIEFRGHLDVLFINYVDEYFKDKVLTN